MKKIIFLILFLYCNFNVFSEPTDTLQLLTNNSSKDWYYSKIIANGNLWEEDTIHFCIYQNILIFKNNGLYDKISPCPNPVAGTNIEYLLKGDSLILGVDTLVIKSITEDTLLLYEKAYVTMEGTVIGIVEWDITLTSEKNTNITFSDKNEELCIYPNPCLNHFNITGINNVKYIDIYNEIGQIFKTPIIYNKNNIFIDTSLLETGTYQCIIHTKSNIISKSFIKL